MQLVASVDDQIDPGAHSTKHFLQVVVCKSWHLVDWLQCSSTCAAVVAQWKSRCLLIKRLWVQIKLDTRAFFSLNPISEMFPCGRARAFFSK